MRNVEAGGWADCWLKSQTAEDISFLTPRTQTPAQEKHRGLTQAALMQADSMLLFRGACLQARCCFNIFVNMIFPCKQHFLPGFSEPCFFFWLYNDTSSLHITTAHFKNGGFKRLCWWQLQHGDLGSDGVVKWRIDTRRIAEKHDCTKVGKGVATWLQFGVAKYSWKENHLHLYRF